eukprot:COSAG03_NODE_10911_length_622_cov_0.977055_1_plen_198_part_10
MGVRELELTVPEGIQTATDSLDMQVDGTLTAAVSDELTISAESATIATAGSTDIISGDSLSVTTSDYTVSSMTYLSEGYDSWHAYSASDMRLGTPTAAVRMMSGGEAQLQSVDWEHPPAFNDAEMLFSEVPETEEIALTNVVQATNPRFCRGANAPTTVYIDLFDALQSAWTNIHNTTVHEHCEYIHGTKLRFPKMNV